MGNCLLYCQTLLSWEPNRSRNKFLFLKRNLFTHLLYSPQHKIETIFLLSPQPSKAMVPISMMIHAIVPLRVLQTDNSQEYSILIASIVQNYEIKHCRKLAVCEREIQMLGWKGCRINGEI